MGTRGDGGADCPLKEPLVGACCQVDCISEVNGVWSSRNNGVPPSGSLKFTPKKGSPKSLLNSLGSTLRDVVDSAGVLE